jgi:hypothetical protein
MKITLLLCALACNAFAAQPVLVRVTPQTLANLQARDPMIRLVTTDQREVEPVAPARESIVKESTILHDGTHWTLVPSDAVVFLPDALRDKVNARPVGTLLSWSEFLAKNPGWLAASEVTFDEAVGLDNIPAERSARWAGERKIVVTVHKQDPISVRVAKPAQALARR